MANLTQEQLSLIEEGKQLGRAMTNHGKHLEEMINSCVIGDEKGNAYVTKKEVTDLLEHHFKQVEQLLNTYQLQIPKTSFTERLTDLQTNLKTMGQEFKESLQKRSLAMRQAVVNKVQQVKNGIQERVDEVKYTAKNSVWQSVALVNNRIKDFTLYMDQQLEKYEPILPRSKQRDLKKPSTSSEMEEKFEEVTTVNQQKEQEVQEAQQDKLINEQERVQQLREEFHHELDRCFAEPERMKSYLELMGRMDHYSVANTALIHAVNPMAQFVTTSQARNKRDVTIVKGEQPIQVMVPHSVPCFPRKVDDKTQWIPVANATEEEKQFIDQGQLKTRNQLSFKVGEVFEYAQTKDAKLPNLNRSPKFSALPNEMNHSIVNVSNIRLLAIQSIKSDQTEKEQRNFTREEKLQTDMVTYVLANRYNLSTNPDFIDKWAENLRNIHSDKQVSLLQSVKKVAGQVEKEIQRHIENEKGQSEKTKKKAKKQTVEMER